MKKFLLAIFGTFALAAPVQAADMAVKAAAAPMIATMYDWSGFYAGLHGGVAWERISGVHDIGSAPTGSVDLSRLDDTTGIIGGQVGYNLQRGNWVFGVEIDASKGLNTSNVNGDCNNGSCFSVRNRLDWLASVRGRVGWALGEEGRWLPFVTAGWGWTSNEYGAFEYPGHAVGGPSGTIRINRSGAVVGGGVEYAWMRWARLRVEYLHYFTGTTRSFANDELVDNDLGDFVRNRGVDVVRAAVSIPFGNVGR